MDAFIFQAAGDFSSFDRGAQSAWDRAQGYINKRPIKLRIEDNASQPLGRITAGVGNFDRALDAATKRVLTFGIVAKSFAKIEQGINSFVKSAVDVQSALTRINVGLNLSQKQLEGFSSSLFNIARDTGQNFDDTAKAAERLSKQNLGVAETTNRLKAAMTLTRLAGIDSAEAVTALTSTLNTFKREGLSATDIIDKLTVANNKFGVSGEVFTESIQRAGLVAQQAGIGFDKFLGIITAVQKVTGRDGASLGTSLNKVLAGLEKPETREKLNSYGIAVKDNKGNQLGGDQVLQNIAVKFAKGINPNDKANILEAVSGQRQEENTIALLDILAKKYNVVTDATNSFAKAQGEGAAANDKQNQSLQSLIRSAQTSFAQLSGRIGAGTVSPAISEGVAIVDSIRKYFSGESGSKIGAGLGDGIIKGIIAVLTGPGLAIVGRVLGLALGKTLSFAKTDLQSLLGINDASEKRAAIQTKINGLLKFASQEDLALINNATTLNGKYNAILGTIIRIQEAKALMEADAAGVRSKFTPSAIKRLKTMADGHIPAVMNEMSDISKGVGGASSSAKPVVIPTFNFGNGHIGTAVANTDEYYVPNFAGGGDAVFNKNMVSKYGIPNGARHLASGHIPNFAGGDLDAREAALRAKGYNISSSPLYNYNRGEGQGVGGTISAKQREILQRVMVEYVESNKEGTKLQKQLNKGLEKASKILNDDSLEDFKNTVKAAKAKVYGIGEAGDPANATAQQSSALKGDVDGPLDINKGKRSRAAQLRRARNAENAAILASEKRRERIQKGAFAASIALPFLSGFLPEQEEGTTGSVATGLLKGGASGFGFGASIAGPIGGIIGGGLGAGLGALGGSKFDIDAYVQESHKTNQELHDAAVAKKQGQDATPQDATPAAAAGRTFLGPKDFLDYNEKSAASFAQAGASARLSGFFANGDTSRNGYLTSLQRAKGNLEFYNAFKEQNPDTDISTNPDFIKNKQVVQRGNALNAAAQFLSRLNPGGRYFDFRGEAIEGAVTQGIDFQSHSSNKDLAAKAGLLAQKLKDSDVVNAANGAHSYSSNRSSDENSLMIQRFDLRVKDAFSHTGITTEEGIHYTPKSERLDTDAVKSIAKQGNKDTQNQIDQLEKIADKINQTKDAAVVKVQISLDEDLERRGYNLSLGDKGGLPILDYLVKGIHKLADEVHKLQKKAPPPGSELAKLRAIQQEY